MIDIAKFVSGIAQAVPFIYPRTVSFYREGSQLAAGNAGYLGHNRGTEALVFSAINASVQCPSIGARRVGDGLLPDDAPGPIRWNIFLPANAVPKGSIISRDIAVDDEGNRYQVAAAYWTPLGYKVQTTRLEA
jgi:hypothetical protein